MWRIQDGKADEHWDYGTIAANAGASPAPPSKVTVK
jgi:predicted SnoaL-like aldol condensation-catalyzing enzyme